MCVCVCVCVCVCARKSRVFVGIMFLCYMNTMLTEACSGQSGSYIDTFSLSLSLLVCRSGSPDAIVWWFIRIVLLWLQDTVVINIATSKKSPVLFLHRFLLKYTKSLIGPSKSPSYCKEPNTMSLDIMIICSVHSVPLLIKQFSLCMKSYVSKVCNIQHTRRKYPGVSDVQ